MTNRFGQKFRKLREAKGVSQTELSRRLGYEGNSYIYDIERGAFIPPETKLKAIARALDVPFRVLRDLLRESRIEDLGIKEADFVSMFRDYPHLTRQDRQAIIKAYREIRAKQGKR